jgi:phosphinothricin acetyltransferase
VSRIRAATPEDAAAIAGIYRYYVENTVISFEETAPDADQLAARMLAEPRLPWLVVEIDGAVAGYAYASRHRARDAYRWAADCSIYLSPGIQRGGWGRRLYTELVDLLRTLNYTAAFAGVTLPNPASERLHEVMGFQPVGVYRGVGYKADRWWDVGWWQLDLSPERPAWPAAPLAWQPSTDHQPTHTPST